MEAEKIPNTNQFESAISHGVALVDFNAPWCAPCRIQHPIIEELSKAFKGKAAIIAHIPHLGGHSFRIIKYHAN